MTPNSTTIRAMHQHDGQTVVLNGWVANTRDSKGLVFIILRDGSGFAQCVVSEAETSEALFAAARSLTQESSVRLTGTVRHDERQVGGYELTVTDIHIFQIAEGYPITPKDHGIEFLMDHRHLWLRSRRQSAIMRVRNRVIMAIHEFFQGEGFIQMDAPIFTGNAVEGTTELFETDFFGQPAFLSQSGQLYGEAMAMALGKIYTFGPTFRAEKSVTRRHLSEFWMIEPEVAFYDLEDDMALIERFIKSVVGAAIRDCAPELVTLERDIEALAKVEKVFPRVAYTEAVRILRGELEVDGLNAISILETDLATATQAVNDINAEMKDIETKLARNDIKKGERKQGESRLLELRKDLERREDQVRNIPKWIESARNFTDGDDLGGSDETVLTRVFDAPVMVYNWPTPIKAFYMKEVEGDPRFVKGVDLLAPEGFGEIIGGSERETDLDILVRKINEHGLPMEAFEWYLDLRRFGSVPHSGFGLGLERLVAWICNIHHVREAIPFPRRYGNLFP